jgi:hypothetical protein
MKFSKYIWLFVITLAVGCSDGYIDDITPVQAGSDKEDPVIEINFPVNGTMIRVVEDEIDITVSFEVIDDILLEQITLQLDGTNFATLTDFKDYRRVVEDVVYEGLTNGSHTLTITAVDGEGKTSSVSVDFDKTAPYSAKYDGEVFYMPFDNEYLELLNLTPATEVGSPGFTSDAKAGTGAYAGAEGSYLTFPAVGLVNDEFSAVMWYKVNPEPNRAGILVMGPEGEDAPPATLNNGFKFFREDAGGNQRFKLNAGTGEGNSWFDGGENADLDPTVDTDWQHLAFTISGSGNKVYINGTIVSEGDYPGPSWEGVENMSIMSGAPNFAHWDHNSDLSQLDELRIFNKALTQEEIQQIIDDES